MSMLNEVRAVSAIVSPRDSDILDVLGFREESVVRAVTRLDGVPEWLRVRAIGKVVRCLNKAGLSRAQALVYARDWIAAIDEHLVEDQNAL